MSKIAYATHPEYGPGRNAYGEVRSWSVPTGRYSIAISGLTATQLAVIEGALANLLVLEGGDQDRGQEATEERGQPALET